MTRSLDTLIAGLIDYAGLFPPAKLDMQPAVENYARSLQGPHAKSLGRFICPSSRLEEFSAKARMLMPGTFATSGYREQADDIAAWRISVVVDTPLDKALDEMDAFNAHHATEDHGLAVADALELRVATPGDIDDAMDVIPEDIFPAFEVPADLVLAGGDVRGFVAALAGEDGVAKIRCGGVTPGAFPSVDSVANFIHACAIADVRFKATAGLHHPVRAEHNLTYDSAPPRAVMHGFLNVFIAAGLAKSGRNDLKLLQKVIAETDPTAFTFTPTHAAWREEKLDLEQISRGRRFAIGYGSCSFEEPIDDLRALGLL